MEQTTVGLAKVEGLHYTQSLGEGGRRHDAQRGKDPSVIWTVTVGAPGDDADERRARTSLVPLLQPVLTIGGQSSQSVIAMTPASLAACDWNVLAAPVCPKPSTLGPIPVIAA